MLNRKITLPPWDKIIRIFGYSGLLTGLSFWVDKVETFPQFLLFFMTMVLGIYLVTEVSNHFLTQNIVIDLRSEEKIKADNHRKRLEMLEGVKTNLMMKLTEGKISLEEAEKRANNTVLFVDNVNRHNKQGALDFINNKKYIEQ